MGTEEAHVPQTRPLICALNGCDLSALTLRRLYAMERTLATVCKESWLDPNGGLNEVAKQLS